MTDSPYFNELKEKFKEFKENESKEYNQNSNHDENPNSPNLVSPILNPHFPTPFIQESNPDDKPYNHKFITLSCLNCGSEYLLHLSCPDKLCPECRGKRVITLRDKLLQIINIVNPKEENLYHITLTIRHNSNQTLTQSVKRIQEYMGKLRRRDIWGQYVSGGCYSYGFTITENGWNVHIHSLVSAENIPTDWENSLREDWKKISKDSFIIDVDEVKNMSKMRQEICKYPFEQIASENFSEENKAEINQVLLNKNLFVRFGDWRNVELKTNPWRCCKCSSTLFYIPEYECDEEIRSQLSHVDLNAFSNKTKQNLHEFYPYYIPEYSGIYHSNGELEFPFFWIHYSESFSDYENIKFWNNGAW